MRETMKIWIILLGASLVINFLVFAVSKKFKSIEAQIQFHECNAHSICKESGQ